MPKTELTERSWKEISNRARRRDLSAVSDESLESAFEKAKDLLSKAYRTENYYERSKKLRAITPIHDEIKYEITKRHNADRKNNSKKKRINSLI